MAQPLPAPLQDALFDIGAIAASPLSVAARLEDIEGRLARELPFVALNQTVLTHACALQSRRSRGYSARILAHLVSERFRADLEAFGSLRPGQSLRLSDLPDDLRGSETVEHYILPEGFRDGITTPLSTPQGRLVGFQHLSFDEVGHLCDPICHLLDRTGCILAQLLDPFTEALSPRTVGWLVIDAEGQVRDGGGAPDPGLAHSKMLRRMQRVAGLDESLWLCPGETCLRQVSLRTMEGGLRLSDLGPAQTPLTQRELEVAASLPLGLSNPQIAALLGITPRTANAHVAAILDKLDVMTRAAAAARIVERGWRLI